MTNKELTKLYQENLIASGLEGLTKIHPRKEFRLLLNQASKGRVEDGGNQWKHNIYGNRKRAYGDYLWAQDRDMFENDYQLWLRNEFEWNV